VGGLETLRKWLRARLFLTNYRPVPLTEYAVFKGTVYAKKVNKQINAAVAATASTTIGGVADYELGSDNCPLEISRVLPQSNSKEDPDRLLPLVSEVTTQGHSVLIFCGTRRNCEVTASLVAKHLNSLLAKQNYSTSARISARQDLISRIQDAMSASLSPQLQETILAGVAWHHAGLSQEEKAGIEAGYRAGTLQVLAATSTLAAGVNLPARRVILRSNLIFGRAAIDRSMYLQMIGRAGRAGQSPVGEAYIIGGGTTFKQNDWNTVCKLITDPVPVLQSQLLVDSTASTTGTQPSTSNSSNTAVDSQLQRLLVESVACGAVTSSVDVQSLLHNTFAYHQHPYITIITAAKNALRALEQEKRLLQSYGPKGSMWKTTTNGTAVYDSALPLDSGLELFNELKTAENGLNTTNGALHAIFLTLKVVKSSSFITIYNWKLWETALGRLNSSTAAVAAAVGVETTYAHALAVGDRGNAVSTEKHARFAAALVINEIAKGEDTLEEVVARWGAPQFLSYSGLARGELQKLQEDVAQHMGMASLLCESAGWWPLATMFSEHAATVTAGVRRELLPLMAVPGMTAGKARALWKGGITGPMVLATVQEEVVFKALTTGVAAQMRAKAAVGAGRYEQQQNSNLGTKAAKGVASRAAKALIAAAREHVVACVELNIAVEPAQDVPAPLQEDGHRRQEGGMSTENLNKSRETFLHDHSFCTEIRLSTSDEDVVQFFTTWAAQPRYSLTLSTSLPCSSPASSTGERVLQGLSVCWDRKEAYFVDFSQRHRTRELVFSSATSTSTIAAATTTVEKAVASILASSSAEIILFGALSTISTLCNAAKLSLGGTLFDLEVAGRLLTPPEPVSARAAVEGALASPPPPLTLKSTLDLIAPELSKEIRVVLNPRAGVTPACRAALLLLVAAEPALRVLASRGLLDCFNLLDLPATIATARGIYSLLGTSEAKAAVAAAKTLLPSSRMVSALDSAPFSSLFPMHFGPENVTVHTSTVHYELSNKLLTPETAHGSIVALWCTPEELCHHSHRHRFHSGAPPLLVIGRILNIQRNGKRLRTALDFSSDLGNAELGCSMATLAVAPLPPHNVDPDCPAAVPSFIEFVRPVDQLWRLTAEAVSEMFTSDEKSSEQQTLGGSPSTTSCDILVWQPQQQPLPSSPILKLNLNTRKKNTWLSIEILNIDLAVIAHLSQDTELLNACTAAAKPWSRVAAIWSVEAKNVAVGGGIVITSATVKAIIHCLIYGWSDARLAYELSVVTNAGGGNQQQISKQQASAAVSSFLGAFRGLKSWQEDTITAWERSYQVKTISGRVCHLPGPSANADPKLRGRMAKAAVAAMLSGGVEDVYLAAIASANRSLIGSNNGVNNGVLVGQQIGRVILTQVPEEFESAAAVGHALKNKLDLGNGSTLAVPLDVSICVGKFIHPVFMRNVLYTNSS
jgi:replicative superfamily II helicase